MANGDEEKVSVTITVRSDSITEAQVLELKRAIKEVAVKFGATVLVQEAPERVFNRP
jgi:hypothetical protein